MKTNTPEPETNKRLWIVICLAFVPGLSLLYLGRWKKSIALFLIDAGVISILVFSNSYLMRLLAVNIYVFASIAPFIESYQLARYGKNTVDSGARWYVIILMLTTGFNALPLLWQSPNFSRISKIGWTITVTVLAAVFVALLVNYGTRVEDMLKSFLG
jgi:hypothetical protein